MLKKGCLIGFFILLGGCSTWNNFRAYYNTYYNAKKSYNAGLQKVYEQSVQLDPDELIRPHPAPAMAGNEQFAKAIDNGAQILRRFSQTKWADDALLLMGKSYYYQRDFFSALQKFEELLALPQQTFLKQQAVIWKARTLLDIKSYNEAEFFIKEQLSALKGNIKPSHKAEMQLLLAEHMAMAGSLQPAVEMAIAAIPNLESNDLKALNYFLLGQMFYRLNDFDKAYQAFTNVASNFPDYEYIYWAEVKAADAARLGGRTELAAAIYSDMLKDDKNFERRNRIYFQLAQTAVQKQNYKQAERIYKRILENPVMNNSDELLTETYYQLSELYSNHYQNYKLAAAYYDSSTTGKAQQTSGENRLISENYGRYISLKADISQTDSLLHLGSLSPAAFDSVLVLVREQKMTKLRRNLPINEPSDNTLANVTVNESSDESEQAYSSAYGFLNYRNRPLVAAGIRQFRAVWGDRPLADNWRRIEAVSTVTLGNRNRDRETGKLKVVEKNAQTNEQLGINIAEVPFTPQEKRLKMKQKYALQYRLGNLFFLTLNEPDSAAIYYRKVANQEANAEVIPKALYSLYQLHRLEQNADSAEVYQKIISEEYSNSIYAQRLGQNMGEGAINSDNPDSAIVLRKKVQDLFANTDSTITVKQRAEKLQFIALENKESPLAPLILYRSIREYIQLAKDSSSIQQGLLQKEDIDQFSYSGPGWHKVRKLIVKFQDLFPEASTIEQIKIWETMLQTEPRTEVLTCEQIGEKPEVLGGMETFIGNIELPENLQNMNLRGALSYNLVINRDGVVERYKLLSNSTNLGIEEVYEKAIEKTLRFVPVLFEGKTVRASCNISFPIKQ